jgi:hypothetical protein
LQELLEYWPIGAAVVAFIAGYTDLKADHRSLRRDFDNASKRQEKERHDDNELTREMFKEIRNDVKLLLQRQNS